MVAKNQFVCAFLILCAITFGFCQKQITSQITFKAVKCDVTPKFAHNFTCFAKSYSRKISTINIKLYAVKPLKDIHVSEAKTNCHVGMKLFLLQLKFVLMFKYGVIYRDAMHSPVFDGCELVKSEST